MINNHILLKMLRKAFGLFGLASLLIGPPQIGQAELVTQIDFQGDNFNATPAYDATKGHYVTFQDKSGQGNHAICFRDVYVNGALHSMDQCPKPIQGPNGSGDQAAEFYGTLCDVQSDHLGIANAPELNNLTQGTMAFWILYHDGIYKNTRAFNNYHNAWPGTWALGREGTTCNLLIVNDDWGSPRRIFNFPDNDLWSANFNTWNHLAVTWDGTTIRGYYNGTLFEEVPQAGITSLKEGTYITVNALNHSDPNNVNDNNCVNYYGGTPGQQYVQPNAGFMNGAVDDIRIYNHPLSSSDVAEMANASLRRSTHILKVVKSGLGHGNVSSSRTGISCGKYCTQAYAPGTSLYLTASPWADAAFAGWESLPPSSPFAGWGSPCSGTGQCNLSMTQNIAVVAKFVRIVEDVAFFEAEDGIIQNASTNIFKIINDQYIVTSGRTANIPGDGARAEYAFTLDAPSEVMVIAKVSCVDTGADSFYVNMDAEPQASCNTSITGDPCHVWDIWSTIGFEDRLVRWRGDDPDGEHPQFDPKWWTLGAGPHKFIVVGREPDSQLDSITIVRKTGATIVVNAGPDRNVLFPDGAPNVQTNLTGQVTVYGTEVDPATLTTTWSKISGPGGVTFGSPNAKQTTVTVDAKGDYEFNLKADGGSYSGSDRVILHFKSNDAPLIVMGGERTVSILAPYLLNVTVQDDGLPTGVLTYAWDQISGPGLVTFNPASANTEDVHVSFSTTGVYELRLTASDGSLNRSGTVRMTVVDYPVTEGPVGSLFGQFKNVLKIGDPEPLRIILTGSSGAFVMTIFDRRGNKVEQFEGTLPTPPIPWTGKNSKGDTVSSGVYILHVTAGGQSGTKRVVVVK